ncbi:unknown [Crocosphaera subtropica ATCC 51142]|uniref:Mechanosensitive ion channel MscS domain-containing protein n=1 Tax=Crocosphaera subtropica (strain ATCC 51142 / BH68) TaxID=43989 RepID=B1WVD2_CROS5|nr:mechanosensitive ion channel domain-containing protein [Crocosphaera subtropica]ACB53922.1 unknown [Crocosphaera subtropica ATCC 51142]
MLEDWKNLSKWLSNPTVEKLIEVAVGIVVIWILLRLLRRFLGRYIKDADIRYRTRKGITFMGYLLILLYTASVFSNSLGQLTVVFGVVGAGIAFAMQEIIVSFAGWIAISFGQFYKPGDRVLLGGIMGDVIDISILRTTLMECGDWVKADLYNGRIVRIANSFVFKEPVYNYSGDFPFLWDEIKVPVKYGSDYKLARQLLDNVVHEVVGDYVHFAQEKWEKMVRKYLIEDARIEPMVTLIANDNWVEFTIRYVVDYKLRRAKKDELFIRILEEIDKTEGKIKLGSATFELVEAPNLNVNIQQ